MMSARGWVEGGGNAEMSIRVYKCPVRKWLSSGDLMYGMVTIDNSTVLYTWKRVNLKCSQYTHAYGGNCMKWWRYELTES